MKKTAVFFVIGFAFLFQKSVFAEWMSIEGTPAKWNDIVLVRIRDLRPTQPAVGFDRLAYKLGRYAKDRRKVFDEYCETNGQLGIRDFTPDSKLLAPESFACLEPVGTVREELKTAVIAPDGELYLTDGHHTFNAYWHVDGGGPDLTFNVVISRDYRELASMDEFWKQMEAEKNIWLFDPDDKPITPSQLPRSFGMENFKDDSYRSLMYFTRRIAWFNPGKMSVSDAKYYGDNYPDLPFVEFYWVRAIRDKVDLSKYDLNTISGYNAAIHSMADAIVGFRSDDVGGSGKPPSQMGQFPSPNLRELARISRPGTGKLAYMLAYKAKWRRARATSK